MFYLTNSVSSLFETKIKSCMYFVCTIKLHNLHTFSISLDSSIIAPCISGTLIRFLIAFITSVLCWMAPDIRSIATFRITHTVLCIIVSSSHKLSPNTKLYNLKTEIFLTLWLNLKKKTKGLGLYSKLSHMIKKIPVFFVV